MSKDPLVCRRIDTTVGYTGFCELYLVLWMLRSIFSTIICLGVVIGYLQSVTTLTFVFHVHCSTEMASSFEEEIVPTNEGGHSYEISLVTENETTDAVPVDDKVWDITDPADAADRAYRASAAAADEAWDDTVGAAERAAEVTKEILLQALCVEGEDFEGTDDDVIIAGAGEVKEETGALDKEEEMEQQSIVHVARKSLRKSLVDVSGFLADMVTGGGDDATDGMSTAAELDLRGLDTPEAADKIWKRMHAYMFANGNARPSDLFHMMDKDRGGYLDEGEFENALNKLELRGVTPELARDIIKMLDSDGDSMISYKELLDKLDATKPPPGRMKELRERTVALKAARALRRGAA